MTPKRQKGCSGAPESRSAAYGRESESGAAPRGIRVIMPSEPPQLTPAAARMLLRILIKARARLSQDQEEDG
jgi:hypothetical protein